jgi:hypothetical protein
MDDSFTIRDSHISLITHNNALAEAGSRGLLSYMRLLLLILNNSTSDLLRASERQSWCGHVRFTTTTAIHQHARPPKPQSLPLSYQHNSVSPAPQLNPPCYFICAHHLFGLLNIRTIP